MATDLNERLEAIRRELDRQDDVLRAAREKLSALGDVRVVVTREQLEEIETAALKDTRAARPVAGIRG